MSLSYPLTLARRPVPRSISLLLITLLGALLFGQAAGVGAEESGLEPVPERPLAPDFDLAGPDGEPQRLASYLGRPLIVNFWATWCPPCRAEMPALQRAHAALADVEGMVIGINVGEDAATVRRFMEQLGIDFPLPLDQQSEVAQGFGVRGLPTTFVIGPDGRQAYVALGEREWDAPALLEQVRGLAVVADAPAD